MCARFSLSPSACLYLQASLQVAHITCDCCVLADSLSYSSYVLPLPGRGCGFACPLQVCDYTFFWANIRHNVAVRVGAFVAKRDAKL